MEREVGHYEVAEGLLCRRVHRPDGDVIRAPVIPEGGARACLVNGKRYQLGWRQQLLHLMHNTTSGGHVGGAALEARLLDHVWWPGLGKDVEAWCRR